MRGWREFREACREGGREPHLIQCSKGKYPCHRWLTPASDAMLDRAYVVGMIAWSIGCAVIDVDEGGLEAAEKIAALYPDSSFIVESRKQDGYHVWIRSEHPQPNRKWKRSFGEGDIRGSNGYIILWEIEELTQRIPGLMAAKPVDVRPFVAREVLIDV